MLFLAIRDKTFKMLFADALGQLLFQHHSIRLIVFDPELEVITQWIP